jgi:hypothetical protein
MLKRTILAVCLALSAPGFGVAQEPGPRAPGLEEAAGYSDPGFQEYVETLYGYLSPLGRASLAADFRDAPAARIKPKAGRTGGYVFVNILPRTRDRAALAAKISATAGFVLAGERTVRLKRQKRTSLLGWARITELATILGDPDVVWLRVERESPLAVKRAL